jgi:hypothetical protein
MAQCLSNQAADKRPHPQKKKNTKYSPTGEATVRPSRDHQVTNRPVFIPGISFLRRRRRELECQLLRMVNGKGKEIYRPICDSFRQLMVYEENLTFFYIMYVSFDYYMLK